MRGAFLRLDIFRRTFLFLFKVRDFKQGFSFVVLEEVDKYSINKMSKNKVILCLLSSSPAPWNRFVEMG